MIIKNSRTAGILGIETYSNKCSGENDFHCHGSFRLAIRTKIRSPSISQNRAQENEQIGIRHLPVIA